MEYRVTHQQKRSIVGVSDFPSYVVRCISHSTSPESAENERWPQADLIPRLLRTEHIDIVDIQSRQTSTNRNTPAISDRKHAESTERVVHIISSVLLLRNDQRRPGITNRRDSIHPPLSSSSSSSSFHFFSSLHSSLLIALIASHCIPLHIYIFFFLFSFLISSFPTNVAGYPS